MGTSGADHLRQIVEETDWYNGIVLDAVVPGGAWKRLPRPLQSWLRNYIGGTALYLVSGFLWCFYIYYLKRNVYVPKGFPLSDLIFFNFSLRFSVNFFMD